MLNSYSWGSHLPDSPRNALTPKIEGPKETHLPGGSCGRNGEEDRCFGAKVIHYSMCLSLAPALCHKCKSASLFVVCCICSLLDPMPGTTGRKPLRCDLGGVPEARLGRAQFDITLLLRILLDRLASQSTGLSFTNVLLRTCAFPHMEGRHAYLLTE